jgi:hypothetical protein
VALERLVEACEMVRARGEGWVEVRPSRGIDIMGVDVKCPRERELRGRDPKEVTL